MATNLTEWIPHVTIPLCPDPVVERAVLDTCRDFCEHTLLWDEQALTAIDIVDGTHTYTLSSDDGDIVMVDSVVVDDVPIYPTSVNEMNRMCKTWRALTSTRSTRYIVGEADEIRLVYEPDEDITGGLEIWVCLKPLETATSVEDFLYRSYKMGIAYGAMALILEMPGMEWTNPELSLLYQSKYEAVRNSAMSKKFTGRTRLEIAAAVPFFA